MPRSNSPFGTCRSCGADIRWVELPGGKRHPLDVQPTPNGAYVLAGPGRGRKLERGETAAGGDAFSSHFSTCPDAKSWSGGGKSRPSPAPRSPPPPPVPTRAPSAVEFVDAIQSTAWHIRAGAEPQLTATAMLHAATQVLIEGGKTVAQVQELVARGVRA